MRANWQLKGSEQRKKKESIIRIGKAVGPLAAVTSNFDRNVLKPTNKHLAGHHKRESISKDQETIVNELLKHTCMFSETARRNHRQFQRIQQQGFHLYES